ncbi:MAG: LppX_LprAFG lipoprotein [Austwickia sp.]|jgi:hypothetical protein|nr:LppX_LprAFG lipoprotein [Austwickia sp.]MBK8436958.1 LppX_LprAFG lipoprotein [Austwickia sp.]MBK9100585.1 LppX_LprAFG lipoprotein [Austwickia sp.]
MTKTRIAAVVLAAPLLLAACGNSGSGSSPSSSAGALAASGTSATSAGLADLGSAQAGQEVDKNSFVEAVNKGTASAKTYALSMTMNMSGQQSGAIAMNGVADVSDQTNQKMKMSMEMPGTAGASSPGNIDMILVDKVMYMKMPGSAGKYFKMTLEEMAKMSGQDLTQAMNPTAQLEKMKESMKKVTFVGEEDIDGVKTRHYKAVIDTTEILPSSTTSASPSSTGTATASSTADSSPSLPKEMPYDIWLDGENRTRKFAMEMAVSGMTVKYDGKLDKFGEPVSISAPPASQVQPMPTSLQSAAS